MASRPDLLHSRGRLGQEESWVEISSQPSSSSLSSVNEDVITTGLRVEQRPPFFPGRRPRQSRPSVPAHSHVQPNVEATSSQEEYEESESESDHVMTSSNEGHASQRRQQQQQQTQQTQQASAPRLDDTPGYISSDGEDGNRTAINHPIPQHHRINSHAPFTPQPNAFNHPTTHSDLRNDSPPGSYFPPSRPALRPSSRQSYPTTPSHLPANILSPTYNAALQHEEALRNSLNTLLSCAAAARALPKGDSSKRAMATENHGTTTAPRSTRIEPISFRLVHESALPTTSGSRTALQEPSFQPTLRRESTSTSASSHEHKRKAAQTTLRSPSRERRTPAKKQRRVQVYDETSTVSPTLLTWIVSAGVVVVLGALSFSAGYSLGKEAGRLEANNLVGVAGEVDEKLLSCAQEAGRSGLGLKRSLARSAVQV